MKKILVILMICGLSMPLFAGGSKDKGNIDAKTEATSTVSAELTALQTAYSLAKYGYRMESASALIGAAEIIARVPIQELGVNPERGGAATSVENPVESPEFTFANLLADARRFAGRDQTMLAWANEVEKIGEARGALGGAKSGNSTLGPRSTERYTITFVGGQLAQVYVSGNGVTDLDLYIYDENGNLIGYDDDRTDECLVQWAPKWTGPFVIEVRNLGTVFNRYYITTN
jgi:hypothetical protein